MAVKKTDVQKESRLKQILMTEYPWENLLLLVLAVLSMALALIIIINKGPISIDADFPVLGVRTNQLIFSWVLFGISFLGLALVSAPFVAPAIPELKKITWAKWPEFIDHSIRVIIFLIFFIYVIFAFDIVVLWLQGLIGLR